ncbi:hypothetical protein [Desulfosarcina ovata]|uniref:Uncharacterized protein n=1 Tax=Desulfosarcina ovata subsp. ovata TaxID=2752305 RepID=A0A5K8A410_9BACT|nr:hypothetical protein [Desulfosarcina ovata]BBO87148.1 hypothetical protein DSCOOX_03280 [Desulfosarcina ovata subsp. ovata]
MQEKFGKSGYQCSIADLFDVKNWDALAWEYFTRNPTDTLFKTELRSRVANGEDYADVVDDLVKRDLVERIGVGSIRIL